MTQFWSSATQNMTEAEDVRRFREINEDDTCIFVDDMKKKLTKEGKPQVLQDQV